MHVLYYMVFSGPELRLRGNRANSLHGMNTRTRPSECSILCIYFFLLLHLGWDECFGLWAVIWCEGGR